MGENGSGGLCVGEKGSVMWMMKRKKPLQYVPLLRPKRTRAQPSKASKRNGSLSTPRNSLFALVMDAKVLGWLFFFFATCIRMLKFLNVICVYMFFHDTRLTASLGLWRTPTTNLLIWPARHLFSTSFSYSSLAVLVLP